MNMPYDNTKNDDEKPEDNGVSNAVDDKTLPPKYGRDGRVLNPAFVANIGRGAPKIEHSVYKTRARLKELGFDVIEEAVKRFRDPKTPHQSKDVMLKIIADRVMPSLKSVELTGEAAKNFGQQYVFQIMAEPMPTQSNAQSSIQSQPIVSTQSLESSITITPTIATNVTLNDIINDDDDDA